MHDQDRPGVVHGEHGSRRLGVELRRRRDRSANAKAGATAQAHGFGGQAQGMTESRKTTTEHQRTTASHHALVVDATAHGSGFLGKGAGLELTVYAELVYVGGETAVTPARPPLLKAAK